MSIKDIRENVGMSKDEFCRRFHIDKRTLNLWETEKYKCPSYAENLIARFIGTEKSRVFINHLPFNRILYISGLSVKDFANFYGIPYYTVARWKEGVRNPKEYVLLLLERAVKEDKLSGLL